MTFYNVLDSVVDALTSSWTEFCVEWLSLLLLHHIKLELWVVISTLSSQKRLEMEQCMWSLKQTRESLMVGPCRLRIWCSLVRLIWKGMTILPQENGPWEYVELQITQPRITNVVDI